MRFVPVIAAALLLAGCASSKPKVAEFNGDSVRLEVTCGLKFDCTKPRAKDQAKADKICATRGRKAQYTSTIDKPEPPGSVFFAYEHLYICV